MPSKPPGDGTSSIRIERARSSQEAASCARLFSFFLSPLFLLKIASLLIFYQYLPSPLLIHHDWNDAALIKSGRKQQNNTKGGVTADIFSLLSSFMKGQKKPPIKSISVSVSRTELFKLFPRAVVCRQNGSVRN